MSSRRRRRSLVAALALVLSVPCARVGAQDADAIAALKAPGAQHKLLEPLVGEWDVEVQVFVPGAQQPLLARGTCERKWIFGGRFVEETMHMQSESLGPYEARITAGHNNWSGAFEWVMQGSHDTATYTWAGGWDAGQRTFSGRGSYWYTDAQGQAQEVRMRVESQWLDADSKRMSTTVWFTFPGAEEAKAVAYSYTRKR